MAILSSAAWDMAPWDMDWATVMASLVAVYPVEVISR